MLLLDRWKRGPPSLCVTFAPIHTQVACYEIRRAWGRELNGLVVVGHRLSGGP